MNNDRATTQQILQDIMTKQEVAGYFGVSDSTVKLWIRGKGVKYPLRSMKIGGRRFIRKEWIKAFIRNNG